MKTKLLFFALIFSTVFTYELQINANVEYSLIFVSVDKSVYNPGENIEVTVFNAEHISAKKNIEIIWIDTGNIIYKKEIDSSSFNLIAPGNVGKYMLKIGINSKTYPPIFFSIEGESTSFKLIGNIIKNDYGSTIGVELSWDKYDIDDDFTVIRIDNEEKIEICKNTISDFFIDVNIKDNSAYEYIVYNGLMPSNSVIQYTSKITYSEFYLNNNNGYIVLKIGDSYMHIDGDESKIDENSEIVTIIDKNDCVFIPIRSVVEKMGGSVLWDENNEVITIIAFENTMEILINSKSFIINSVINTSNVSAMIIDNIAYVPYEYLKTLGCETRWDDENRRVIIKYFKSDR